MDSVYLVEYANSLESGFLKAWKAHSMILTITEPKAGILGDDERLIRYVENCLMMEGFTKDDCLRVAIWIMNRYG